MKKGEAMGNSIFYSGFHRYLPFLMFVVIYSITCLLGAALFLIEYTYFIRLYEYFSGTPVPMLEPGQKWVALNLLLVALLILETRLSFLAQYSAPIIFGVLLFAFLFSVYLVYVQAVLITKYCPWCLTHEALVTIVFALSVKRLMDWMNTGSTIEQISD